MTTISRQLRTATYAERSAAHAVKAICPVCHTPDSVAIVITHEGQCAACTLRLTIATRHAERVLAQKDLGLRSRATWALNILAVGHAPRPVISLSLRRRHLAVRPRPTTKNISEGARR
jgi:hypothetical protein